MGEILKEISFPQNLIPLKENFLRILSFISKRNVIYSESAYAGLSNAIED